MKKTIRSFFTAAISLATLLITGSAGAATPVAVWDGDLADNSTKNDVKIVLNGNQVENGVVTITQATGIQVQNNNFNSQTITVLFKYSNFDTSVTTDRSLITCGGGNNSLTQNIDYFGFYAKGGSTAKGIVSGGAWASNSDAASYSKGNFESSGTIALAYTYNNTTKAYMNGQLVYDASTKLQSSGVRTHCIGIGGNYSTTGSGKLAAATGMKIEGVAIFNELLDATAIAAYKWPTKWTGTEGDWSDATKWSNGVPVANQVAVIPEGAVVTVDGAVASGVTVQGAGTVVYDGKLPGNEKTSYQAAATWTGTVWLKNKTGLTNIDFTDYSNAGSIVRCSGIKGYLEGGAHTVAGTLELINDTFTYGFNLNNGSSNVGNVWTFNHLTGTGDFIADGGSTAGVLVTDWTGFTGNITLSNKTLVFGKTAKANENKFYLETDYTFLLPAGKTITSNGNGIVIDGTLICNGTLSGATTFGAGATMDLSGRALDASAFVNNALTISETTKFVFPADLAPDTAYPLCTGALTATTGYYEITVGEKTALATLTFGEADGAKTVAYQWHAAKNTAEISGDIAWADIDWDEGDFIANADIELTLKKDASITFNEAVIFAKPIRILGGFKATFVCDGAIPTFVMDEEWNEIIHLKNLNFNNWDFSAYTHNGTPIKFTGVTGFGPKNTTGELTVEAILIDEGARKAITVTDGYSDNAAFTFDKISGSGTFTFSKDTDKPPTPTYIFKDVSGFTGKFENTKGLKIVLGNGLGTGYTASAITYLADSKVKAGLGWSAPTAVFTDWMKVIGSVDDTLVTLESEPTALAMVTLLDESGTEKEGLFRLVYESGAVKIAEASEVVVDVANKKDMGAWTIEDPTELAGAGGVQASSLTLTAEAKLILDPTKTPVKLGAAPTFAEGAKLALSAAYKDCALGKFTLLTWTGAAIETEDIFDAESVGGACTLTCVDAPEDGKKQLVLTVGDYANAKKIKVMPLGDSITEGTNLGQNFARPNYRIPLMQKLAANGFNVEALGYQKSCNADSAGVQANPEYEWHCGMSGQMCRTQGAAGWEDSIDVALDMAGEPDIVTFKIGTNDLRGGVQDPEVLFEAWTNVIWKILKARPATRVICGSVIDARDDQTYNTTKVVEFNAKIADFIANGDFPGGRVYFANLNAACPPRDANGNDNGNLADALHPSWIGHDKMSDCWLVKIKEVMAIPFTPEKSITYTTTTAIEDNIPQEYRNGFVKLATYTPTATKKHTSGTALTADDYDYYATDRVEEVFTKVGYYVVLKRKDTALVDYHDHVRFLWVDMAAFGDGTLADFGVPTVKKNQQIVEELHVYSNDTGIRKVEPTDDGAKGFVEFWPFSYGTTASDVEGAPAKLYGYDWNDLCSDSGVYGSMQVHRVFEQGESWNAGEVLFAYNRWTSNNNNEIGIGSFAQKMSSTTIDYTMTAGLEKVNAAAYEVMSIEIWGMPVAIEPTATQDTATIEGCDVAVKYTLGTEAVGYDDWNVDFEVSSDVALVGDEFTLKGSNPLDGETMVDFPSFALEENTPVKLLATFAPQFKVTYADLIAATTTYTCGVVNNVKKDANVTVKIVLSKEGEEDIVVDSSVFETMLKADILPTAKVTPTTAEGYEAVVEFATDDIGAGYNDWNAKFILIPNVAIGEGEIKLGGSYAAYEEGKWIDLEFPACAANAEIDVLGLGGIENITVETVFETIESFKCGVKNIGLKNDATFTLKLVITDGATTKEICSIDNLKVEAKAIEPVVPGEDIDIPADKDPEKYAEEVEAQKATLLKAPVELTGEALTTYQGYFTAQVVGDNKVAFVLNTDGENAVEAEVKAVEADVLSVALSADTTEFTIAEPLKGFYYSLKQGGELTDLGFNDAGDKNKLGGKDEIKFTLTKPEGKGFYQTIVTPVEYK